MRGKKALLLITMMLLSAAIAAVPIPVKAQGEAVNLVFRYPAGLDYYPPGTEEFTLDIEAPDGWLNTSRGFVGGGFDVRVDGSVLTPRGVRTSESGYYLYDYIATLPDPGIYWPSNLVGGINSTTMSQVGEFIMGWETLGKGAGGSSSGNTYGYMTLRYDIVGKQTLTLRPDSDGTYRTWATFGTGTAHWDRTSDLNDATGVQRTGTATGNRETENLEDTTQTGVITSITSCMRSQVIGGTGAAETAYVLTVIGGTVYQSDTLFTISRTGWVNYNQTYKINPETGSAWTWDDVNGLEVGARQMAALATGETQQVSEFWLVVTYLPDDVADNQSDITITNAYYWHANGTKHAFDSVEVGKYGIEVPEFPLGIGIAIEMGLLIAIVYIWLTRRKTKPTIPKRFTTQTLSQ